MSDIRTGGEFVLVNENTTNDVILNKTVIGRIETMQKIQVNEDFSQFPPSDMPPLPLTGEWCEAGLMYTDGTLNWCVIKSHTRTIYDPVETPALFRQYFEQNMPWKQPQDEFDAYNIGNRVTYDPNDYA